MRGGSPVSGVGVALATLIAPAALLAAQDVSGHWDVTWAQAVRNERDGTMTIQKWGEATLELTQEGDRVTGTWTTRIRGVVTWKVDGMLRGGRLSLTATEHDSDDPELAAIARMRWRATLSGDHLDGEMTLSFEGAGRERRWRPWRADRAPPNR